MARAPWSQRSGRPSGLPRAALAAPASSGRSRGRQRPWPVFPARVSTRRRPALPESGAARARRCPSPALSAGTRAAGLVALHSPAGTRRYMRDGWQAVRVSVPCKGRTLRVPMSQTGLRAWASADRWRVATDCGGCRHTWRDWTPGRCCAGMPRNGLRATRPPRGFATYAGHDTPVCTAGPRPCVTPARALVSVAGTRPAPPPGPRRSPGSSAGRRTARLHVHRCPLLSPSPPQCAYAQRC